MPARDVASSKSASSSLSPAAFLEGGGEAAVLFQNPTWLAITVLEMVKEGLLVLRSHLEDSQKEKEISWEHPWVELQFFADSGAEQAVGARPAPEIRARERETFLALRKRSSRQRFLKVFDVLTSSCAAGPEGAPVKASSRRKAAASAAQSPFLVGRVAAPRAERAAMIRSELAAQVADLLDDALTFTSFLGGGYDVHVAAEFHPLTTQHEPGAGERPFYPLVLGVVFHPLPGDEGELPTPGVWNREERGEFWDSLFSRLDGRIVGLMAELQAEAGEAGTHEKTPLPSASPKPDKVVVPQRRVSIMSPVPMPRSVAKDAAGWALVRGLGRMFGGYRQIPDYDLMGRLSTEEAERLFWEALREKLEDEEVRYEEAREGSRTVFTLQGWNERETRQFWDAFVKSLNKGQNGPGIAVQPAGIEAGNYFDRQSRKAAVATRLVLWPEEALKDEDGDSFAQAPVRFRGEGSPGYMALLRRHGQKPFFADGWLWIPREGEREGFRIGGLSTLLFPEGRAAIERIKRRELDDYETRLNRIFQEPSLFKDEDERTIRELQAAIRRVKTWLKTLTTYDCMDLVLCIFEAFHRQRDSWIAEQVTLRDGRRIRTTPWRVIVLEPEELRSRLDPGRKWGQNWRNLLFEKLEALTTFERQTRTVIGRKVDVGDRFLMRVLDGFRGSDESTLSETDPGMGLTRALKRANAFPIDAFFAVVSTDFMERLITWAVDENGVVRWGIDAAKAAERAALSADPQNVQEARSVAREINKEARQRPYYDHSPRLLTFGNLEEWPLEWRIFAHLLLQEATPNFETTREARGGTERRRLKPNPLGGKHRLVPLRGGPAYYLSCNGSLGRGYQLKRWMNQAGFIKEPGNREAMEAFAHFLECLRGFQKSLGLRFELLSGSGGRALIDDEAMEFLESLEETPAQAHKLLMRFYLPADLEKRLRDRLAEAGIDALDEGEEELVKVLQEEQARAQEVISPTQLRDARKRAGLTQAELGDMVGVSQQVIGYWEKAVKPIPIERQRELQEALKGHFEEG